MVVGSGTIEGNEIAVGNITFDDSYSVPGGGIKSCCWQRAGGTSGIRNVSFPKKVSVYWSDLSQRRIYFNDVELDHALGAKLAGNLPIITIESSGIKPRVKPYIILGFGEQGEVKVWLSNAPHGDNISGRVLHEIGSAQAQWNPMRED